MHYRALVLLSSLHCSCLSLASISVLKRMLFPLHVVRRVIYYIFTDTAHSSVPRSPPAAQVHARTRPSWKTKLTMSLVWGEDFCGTRSMSNCSPAQTTSCGAGQ
ncbi:hypothetical protein B0H14DRAFT_2697675 [Mycena olivaceomarginata]|nr:hypothetical protein B0H14DRAFT_2697675 [Mycena olivaceomarginata]